MFQDYKNKFFLRVLQMLNRGLRICFCENLAISYFSIAAAHYFKLSLRRVHIYR